MTKFTARFTDGTEIVRTSEQFRNRLDFYNWICVNRLGRKHGKLLEITCSILPG